MKKRLSPADVVITEFGGVRATARALGRTPSAVSLWRKLPPSGIGGRVPGKLHELILDMARSRGISITAEELVRGRSEVRGHEKATVHPARKGMRHRL